MKTSSRPCSLSLTLLIGSLALTGCGGVMTLPDTNVGTAIHPGAFKGSVFGGHAPIVGAAVYVYEVGHKGYGSASLPELTSGTKDANGNFYTTTDASGDFSISGNYTCDAGEPVYLAAVGGNPGVTGTTTSNATVTITKASNTYKTSGNNNDPTYTYTITFTGTNIPAAGQNVTLGNLSGNYAAVGGTTYQVVSATATTFQITYTQKDDKGAELTGSTTGSGTYTATTATPTSANPAITNMAVLGNCPGNDGEFANTLGFVNINEVSTVATAYAFAGFSTGPFNIGASSTNLPGIQNAALTAGQLYNIQYLESTNANATTPNGNGTVPQATVDTLANILASCVDSVNTANSAKTPEETGASSPCYTLFENATSNGVPYGDDGAGTVPTDTGTAIFNIAQYPAGAAADSADVMAKLFSVQGSGSTPFTPDLDAAPNDLTITIAYTGGGIGESLGESPLAVAVDGSGNIYTYNSSATDTTLSILSPLGVPLSATGFSGNGLAAPDSVAIDSGSKYVWITDFDSGYISRFSTTGDAAGSYPTGQEQLQNAVLDGSGNVWATSDVYTAGYNGGGNMNNSKNALIELTADGTGTAKTFTTGVNVPYSLAFEPGATGNVWVANYGQNSATLYTDAGTEVGTYAGNDGGDVCAAIGTAVDASGDVWLADHNGNVSKLTSDGGHVTNSPFPTGAGGRGNDGGCAVDTTNYSDGIAIDGLGNVWVSNPSGTIYELSNAGAQITPTTGYIAPQNANPDGIAIDGSGNVWYDSSNNAALYELVGAAVPVVTPISAAVANSELGQEP